MPPKRKSNSFESAPKQVPSEATVTRREWEACLDHDVVARASIMALGKGNTDIMDKVLAQMDELLLVALEKTLRDHSLNPGPGDNCRCGCGRKRIPGARCRSCWKREVMREGCVALQWCDMCLCSASAHDDELMCNLERADCSDCKPDNPCEEHDIDWENTVCEADDTRHRPWTFLEVVRARHAKGDVDLRNGIEKAMCARD